MTDPVVENLLLLYSGLLVINSAVTAVLWRRNRSPLFRALFFVWASTMVSFVIQGVLQQSSLVIVLGFTSAFPVNLSLAYLMGHAVDVDVRWRPLLAILLAGAVLAVAASALGAPFWGIALPVCAAVSLPTAVTGTRVIATRWRRLTVSGRVLVLSSLAFAAHNLDFAFLRDRPAFAPIGFTLAILIVFGLSVSGPALALEIVTEKQARTATELEAARRIQTMILPRELELPGLEVVGYMRPADSVGGDYFDVYRSGDDCWLLLGDVTGHGLGAGLVMLMAQSTLAAIVQARPEVSPSELNHLANRILRGNLARLDERRHMTIVSIRCRANHFVISGSHDDVLLWRRRTGTVETVRVSHFPWGLGFLDLGPADVGQEELRLEEGDVLFIGTDGVVEAAREGDPRRGVFGEETVSEILASHAMRPLEEIKERLLGRLEDFTRGVYHDDVAFLLVRASEAAR